MVPALRVAVKVLCAFVIGLLIWYALHFTDGAGLLDINAFQHTDSKFCKWPPATPNDILTESSTYNITICVQVPSQASAVNTIKTYAIQDLFRNVKIDKWVSFKDIGECNRSIWQLAIYPNVYRTYPQDVPIDAIVKAIKSGSPASTMPQYNFPISILRTSKSVCHGNSTHDLVMVVKSGILGWERRRRFRAYMQRQRVLNPNTKVGVVFSLGLPRQHGGRIFNRDGYTTILGGPSGDLMDEYVGMSKEVMQKVEEEMRKYDDIVLADYEDTYYNLSWKTVANLRWISAFCDKKRHDIFMLIDDDHRVNISNLMSFLASLPSHKKRTTLFGRIAKTDGAFRSPLVKLFLSFREVPWDVMCAYPRGFCQLIGADIVDDMAIGSAYTRHNYVHEDVYLGLLAFKLGISLSHVDSMFDHGEVESRKPLMSQVMVAESKYMDIT